MVTVTQTLDVLPKQALDFSGMRVLLVEDQPVNQLLMKTILQKVNCQTDLAKNGIEAVQRDQRKRL